VSEIDIFQLIGVLVVVFAFGVYIARIDRKVRATSNQLGRLSLTFIKIEGELAAIQDSLLVLARGKDTEEIITKLRARRDRRFRHFVENGPNLPQTMRGLVLPETDEDPAFWATDRLRQFGYDDSDEEEGEF
jgi:hypothetical protein